MKTTTHEFPISEDQQQRIAAGETVEIVSLEVRASEGRDEDRERLESEAIEYLLAWHTEKDPAKRSAAWHRMISAADDLIAFRENHPIRNTDDVSDDGKWVNWSYPEEGIRPAEQ